MKKHPTPANITNEELPTKAAAKPPLMYIDEAQRLLLELEVHQFKLERQNEELRTIQEELELAHTRYAELFDFAPIGYFILDQLGRIQQTNLVGAQLLGGERSRFIDQPFNRFIDDPDERLDFTSHLKKTLQSQKMLCFELNFKRSDGSRFQGLLQISTVTTSTCLDGQILMSLIDDTDNRTLRLKLQQSRAILEETVRKRTTELNQTNTQLLHEIEEHKLAKEELTKALSRIQQLSERLQMENIHLQQEVTKKYSFAEVIGQSRSMSQVFSQVEKVAPQDATVLLLGETGSGKGLVAHAIHSRSQRKNRPMITVNCAALPCNLIESELFGREKGAFTGASARQTGRFEVADGGTIFLDEIGEMPLELQVKLLRVIQDGEFERLGSPHTIKVNVRIIAASNRNLEDEVRAGRFRQDLFYRISVFPITIPPLRQRSNDIPLLARHFIDKYNKKYGKKIDSVSKKTMEALQKYQWPGNVRELENVIERAIIISQKSVLQISELVDTCRAPGHEETIKTLDDLERDHILQALHQTMWRIEGEKGAARLLDINPSTLRGRMRKFGLRRP